MADAVEIPLEIKLIMSRYTRDARSVVREASGMTAALKDVEQQAKRTARALDSLKSGNITLDVDTSKVSAARSDINALDNLSPKIEVALDVNEEQAKAEINSLTAPTLDVDLQVDEQSVQSEINSISAPSLKVDLTADTSAVKSAIKDVGSSPVLLTFDVSQLPGAIGGVLGTAAGVTGAGTAIELGNITRELQGELGLTEEQAAATTGVIVDLYQNGIGGNLEEVTDMVTRTSDLASAQANLEGAVSSTAKASMLLGTSYEEQLANADKLVSSGLVGSIEEANDALLQARRIGADANRDIGGVIEEFAGNFSAANFTLSEFIGLSAEALAVGGRNAELVGETVLELTNSIDTALTDVASDQAGILDALGLTDEAGLVSEGTMSGAAFMQAFLEETNAQLAAGEIDQSTANNFVRNFFGSNAENFGLERFLKIDWTKVQGTEIPQGIVDESAALYTDTIGNAVTELGRTIQTELGQSFRIAGLSMSEVLDGAKLKIREIADLLQEGKSLPQALEIALEAPGLAATIQRFEALAGNLIIELLTGLANVVDSLPGGDASGLRGTVSQMAGTQLAFDIALDPSNMEHVEFAVQNALRRGVEGAEIGEQLARAGQRLIEEGDLEGARELLETVEAIPAAYAKFTAVARGSGVVEEVILPLSPEIAGDPAAIQAEIDAALAALGAAGGYMQGGLEVELAPQVDTAALEGLVFGATSDLGTAAQDWMTNLVNFADTNLKPPLSDQDAVNLAAGALAAGDVATALQAANDAGWPITEEQLALIGQSSDDFFVLHGKLTEYTLGLTDAQTDGVAALDTLKTEGIDVVIAAQDTLVQGMDAYVLGVQGGLEIAKVSWQDYLDWLTANGLALNADGSVGTLAPGTPVKLNYAGGVTSPGLNSVGERGREFISSDTALAVLNNMTTEALMRGVGMAMQGGNTSNTTNYINVNVMNNNANQAAGISSSDRLSANLRGFN